MTRESDIVEQLRNAHGPFPDHWSLYKEAADEIARLDEELRQADKNLLEAIEQRDRALAEVERLRAALHTILSAFRDDQGLVWHKEARAALEPKP